MSRYNILNLPHAERVPDGYELIEAYAKGDTVVIPIEPNGLDEDDHNCDWEGCTTLSHVLSISPQQKYLLERAAGKAESVTTGTQQLKQAIALVRSNSDYLMSTDRAAFLLSLTALEATACV